MPRERTYYNPYVRYDWLTPFRTGREAVPTYRRRWGQRSDEQYPPPNRRPTDIDLYSRGAPVDPSGLHRQFHEADAAERTAILSVFGVPARINFLREYRAWRTAVEDYIRRRTHQMAAFGSRVRRSRYLPPPPVMAHISSYI